MVFFINNDGTVANTFPSQVYQGSDGANRLLVIAPFAENLTAAVRFLLPNGVISRPYNMTYTGRLTGIADENGRAIFGWSMDLPSEISVYYGTVTAQFFFYAAGRITATSAASFTVRRGRSGALTRRAFGGDIRGNTGSCFHVTTGPRKRILCLAIGICVEFVLSLWSERTRILSDGRIRRIREIADRG